MNKVLILSVRPEHAIKILNGEKTLELRKSVPKGYKGYVYVYVTKRKPNIYKSILWTPLNGTIPFRFWFDEWEYFNPMYFENTGIKELDYIVDGSLRDKLCLEDDDITAYGKGKDLYAWHIKQLDIFYYPMWLSDFIVGLNYLGDIIPPTYKKLTKAPQSYQYVWVKGALK